MLTLIITLQLYQHHRQNPRILAIHLLVAATRSAACVARASCVNAFRSTLAIPTRVVAPSVWATLNVLPIGLAYATSAPILAPVPAAWRPCAMLTITFPSARAPRATRVTPSYSVHV